MERAIYCIINKNINPYDTAFGNRLYMWAQCFYVSYRTNFEYKIYVQEEYWPELKFLNLPNTEALPRNKFYPKQKVYKISENHIESIILNKNIRHLMREKYWYIDNWCIFDHVRKIHIENLDIPNPYSLIKFKNPSINEILKNYFKSFVTIHIRRYHGIHYSEEDLNEMPQKLKEEYLNEAYYGEECTSYVYIKDETYYKIIEKLINSNKNVKIYISTDLPLKYYKHYKTRYFKTALKDKYDYYEKMKNILKECFSEDLIDSNKKIVEDLLDFFVTAYSKFVVLPSASTWSRIAVKIKNTKHLKLPIDDAALNLLRFKM